MMMAMTVILVGNGCAGCFLVTAAAVVFIDQTDVKV